MRFKHCTELAHIHFSMIDDDDAASPPLLQFSMSELTKHPYFKSYRKMRDKQRAFERETLSRRYITPIGLVCNLVQLAWFDLTTIKSKRDFIKKFGDDGLCFLWFRD